MPAKLDKKQWSTRILFFAAGIAAAALFHALLAPRSNPAVQHSAALAASAPRIASDPDRTKPGGHIEALEIPFGDSENLFPDRAARMEPPHWFFEDLSEKQVVDFLTSCDLTEGQKTDLLQKSPWLAASNGFWVSPSRALVRSLNSSARGRIYSLLARSSENYPQRFSFRLPLNDFDSRLARSGLSPDKLAAIKSLTYTNSGALCFAGVNLLPDFLAPEEIDRVMDCLYRLPTYRLRLRIYQDSDIDALVKYYANGGRERRVRPLIESLRKTPATNGVSVNIAYFFPAFARLRLNTFPNSWSDPQASKEDCFWTSMNFFADQPDSRYLDSAYVRQVLRQEFAPVTGQPVFGDLVTLVNEAGDALHMCVYIVDDFVFSKNGVNQLAPWVLMKLPDMLLYFPSETSQHIVIFRRRQPPAPRG